MKIKEVSADVKVSKNYTFGDESFVSQRISLEKRKNNKMRMFMIYKGVKNE